MHPLLGREKPEWLAYDTLRRCGVPRVMHYPRVSRYKFVQDLDFIWSNILAQALHSIPRCHSRLLEYLSDSRTSFCQLICFLDLPCRTYSYTEYWSHCMLPPSLCSCGMSYQPNWRQDQLVHQTLRSESQTFDHKRFPSIKH